MKKFLFLIFLTPYVFGDIYKYDCITISNNKFPRATGFETSWIVDKNKKSAFLIASGRNGEVTFNPNTYLKILWWNDYSFSGKFDNANTVLNDTVYVFNSIDRTYQSSSAYKDETKGEQINKASCEVKRISSSSGILKDKNSIDKEIIKVSSGTGFAVNNKGYIITNSHVVDGCNRVDVHSKGEIYSSKIIANDYINDLALIKINLLTKEFFTINNENPKLLDDVYAAGYPFGDFVSSSVKVTSGIVSALTGIGNNYSQIQIDAALQPGNSGGPIFNKKGVLMGVAVSKLSLESILESYDVVPENVNFAIKSSVVKNLLLSNAIDFDIKEKSNSDISNNITDATFFLSCWMERGKIKEYENTKVMFKNITQ